MSYDVRIKSAGSFSNENDERVKSLDLERISKKFQFSTSAPGDDDTAENGTIWIQLNGNGVAVTVYVKDKNGTWNGG